MDQVPPDIEIVSDAVRSIKESLVCVVCLDVLKSPTYTGCGHVCCAACIQRLLRNKKPVCPLCKAKLTRRTVAYDETIGSCVSLFENLVHAVRQDCGVDVFSLARRPTHTRESSTADLSFSRLKGLDNRKTRDPSPQPGTSGIQKRPDRAESKAGTPCSQDEFQQGNVVKSAVKNWLEQMPSQCLEFDLRTQMSEPWTPPTEVDVSKRPSLGKGRKRSSLASKENNESARKRAKRTSKNVPEKKLTPLNRKSARVAPEKIPERSKELIFDDAREKRNSESETELQVSVGSAKKNWSNVVSVGREMRGRRKKLKRLNVSIEKSQKDEGYGKPDQQEDEASGKQDHRKDKETLPGGESLQEVVTEPIATTLSERTVELPAEELSDSGLQDKGAPAVLRPRTPRSKDTGQEDPGSQRKSLGREDHVKLPDSGLKAKGAPAVLGRGSSRLKDTGQEDHGSQRKSLGRGDHVTSFLKLGSMIVNRKVRPVKYFYRKSCARQVLVRPPGLAFFTELTLGYNPVDTRTLQMMLQINALRNVEGQIRKDDSPKGNTSAIAETSSADERTEEKEKTVVEKENGLLEKDKRVLEKDETVLEKDKRALEKDETVLEKDQIVQERNKEQSLIEREPTNKESEPSNGDDTGRASSPESILVVHLPDTESQCQLAWKNPVRNKGARTPERRKTFGDIKLRSPDMDSQLKFLERSPVSKFPEQQQQHQQKQQAQQEQQKQRVQQQQRKPEDQHKQSKAEQQQDQQQRRKDQQQQPAKKQQQRDLTRDILEVKGEHSRALIRKSQESPKKQFQTPKRLSERDETLTDDGSDTERGMFSMTTQILNDTAKDRGDRSMAAESEAETAKRKRLISVDSEEASQLNEILSDWCKDADESQQGLKRRRFDPGPSSSLKKDRARSEATIPRAAAPENVKRSLFRGTGSTVGYNLFKNREGQRPVTPVPRRRPASRGPRGDLEDAGLNSIIDQVRRIQRTGEAQESWNPKKPSCNVASLMQDTFDDAMANIDTQMLICEIKAGNGGSGAIANVANQQRQQAQQKLQEQQRLQQMQQEKLQQQVPPAQRNQLGQEAQRNEPVQEPKTSQKPQQLQKSAQELQRQILQEGKRNQAVQDGPRNQVRQDGPRNQALQDGPRNQALQDVPRNHVLQDEPRNQALQDEPRNQVLQDGPRNQVLQDGPRKQVLHDGPRPEELKARRPLRVPSKLDSGTSTPKSLFSDETLFGENQRVGSSGVEPVRRSSDDRITVCAVSSDEQNSDDTLVGAEDKEQDSLMDVTQHEILLKRFEQDLFACGDHRRIQDTSTPKRAPPISNRSDEEVEREETGEEDIVENTPTRTNKSFSSKPVGRSPVHGANRTPLGGDSLRRTSGWSRTVRTPSRTPSMPREAVETERTPNAASPGTDGSEDSMDTQSTVALDRDRLDEILNEMDEPWPRSTKDLCLTTSNLSQAKVQATRVLARKLGGRFTRSFTEDVTHMIVGTYGRSNCAKQTLKYVQGIASRKWVLGFGWVKDSLNAKQELPGEAYEVLDCDTMAPGARRSRTRTEDLFREFAFYCVEPYVTISMDGCRDILTALGGLVAESLQELAKMEDRYRIIVCQSEDHDDSQVIDWHNRAKAVPVTYEWLVDSVSQYQVRPLRLYLRELLPRDVLALGYPKYIVGEDSLEDPDV